MDWSCIRLNADKKNLLLVLKYKILVGKSEGKNHWGDQDVDGRIILRWILRKWDVGVWTR